LSFAFDFVASDFSWPAWRNWQTRWTQNPVAARSCGFEPLRRQTLFFIGKTRGKLLFTRLFLASDQNPGNERKYGFAERESSCSVMQLCPFLRRI
jgi:hypothetical protein